MGKKILFVDDEQAILRTFKRSLRGSDLEVFVAEDGHAALEILAVQSIDIILSDMRMPDMNGHQLLRKVKELHPATTRLILSGYAEEQEITRAIMDGSSKMYILKPWDSQMLNKTIRQLLDVREMLRDRNLLEIINKIGGLCSLPRIFDKLTELINHDADMQQIAAVIEEDPIVAAKMLHMVNSAFYGIRTGSVSQAINFLGLTAVKGIVLSTCIGGLVAVRAAGVFSKDTLWRHASLTNRLAGGLYRKLTGKHIPPSASTVGLLHGIGRMALVQQMPEKYEKMSTVLRQRPGTLLNDLEKELIGVSHQEVGGYLLDWWDLPQQIVETAMFYHDPLHDSIGDREIVSIVHIASHYALRSVCPRLAQNLDERAFNLLNTTRQHCERLILDEQSENRV